MPKRTLAVPEGEGDPAIRILERRVQANENDHEARYQLAVLLLLPAAYKYYYRKSAVLRRARSLLGEAVALEPLKSAYHALLGFVDSHNEKTLTSALESFRTALRLKPKDQVLQVYVPALLAEMGQEREAIHEIQKAAMLQDVDLRIHRAELRKAGMPARADNLLQAFLRPRNYFTSNLWDQDERIRKALLPAAHARNVRAIRDDCRRRQRELRDSFDRARVPEAIRQLATAASRYGVGDDACRPLLMKGLSKESRKGLKQKAKRLARPIQAWLDSFPPGAMSEEAAAYMYLLEGLEEMD
jgi:hypothetical protein